jgi:hypothetical protein
MSELNSDYFLQVLPRLRKCIEGQVACEQVLRIKKRISLAHFYNAYALAQENPDTYLELTEEHFRGSGRSLRPIKQSRKESMVKQRFIDVVFSEPAEKEQARTNLSLLFWEPARKEQDRIDLHREEILTPKTKCRKLENMNGLGKPWSEFITRLGYETLIITPRELTDEM